MGLSTGPNVTSIAKAGSTALNGAVTLTGGSNVTLTQSGQDISIAASAGGSSSRSVAQTGHGFAVGDVVRLNGTDSYTKSKADSAANAEVAGIVSAVADVDNFTLSHIEGAYITGLSGLTANTLYFLSAATAGAITSTEPSTVGQISKPVLWASTTTAGYLIGQRGATVTTAVAALVCNGRLTLTSATPVTTSDVTGATNVYFTPYNGNRISLYDGTSWQTVTFTEQTLALGTITNDLPYDVFGVLSSGALTLTKLAWSSKTARATNVILTQAGSEGVYCKSGDATSRYLGTFHTTATTTTEDSIARRLLWNCYNRVSRQLLATDATNSWTYTTAAFRAANNNTTDGTGRVAVVVGLSEDIVVCRAISFAENNTSGVNALPGIGIDSTTVNSATMYVGATDATGVGDNGTAIYEKTLAVGYHFIQKEEYSTATGTTTWYGDANDPTTKSIGMSGWIMA
jgi:hypothetical protein